jgi:hypothetical protein
MAFRMKEDDIRKRETFTTYLSLVEKDSTTFFNNEQFAIIECPACGSRHFTKEYMRAGFTYGTCDVCRTLYVNPRPPAEDLARFYAQAPSTSYWVNQFFAPVAEA